MNDHDPDWAASPEPGSPEAARARMAASLTASGRALSQPVRDAFAQVPRHLFLPEIGQAAAYQDEAFVLKCGPDGIPVSSSSQPAMMAIMLEQLDLQPGHRVLEIGTGSGYNAALMSLITGPEGHVVSVDIDAELVERARSSLADAGFGAVEVRCADGGYGDPDGAPFDRIMVTAGAWDIAPAWLDQLTAAGRLVLPLSVCGIELSVALERTADDAWISTSACRCGFVRMLGAYARPQLALRLVGHDVLVQVGDGGVDADALREALAGPATEVDAGLRVHEQSELGDLDLWLTLTEPELTRLTVLTAAGRLPGQVLPFGGLASHITEAARLGVAALLPGAAGRSGAEITVRGYGPGGDELADHLARRARHWAGLGKPGVADVLLRVVPGPAETGPEAELPASLTPELAHREDGMVVLDRPSATIAVSWLPVR
jgi:protein-L-isoaspartate(D-aspartate) O-methyltransferase